MTERPRIVQVGGAEAEDELRIVDHRPIVIVGALDGDEDRVLIAMAAHWHAARAHQCQLVCLQGAGAAGGPVWLISRVGPFSVQSKPPGVSCHTSKHTMTHSLITL